jgi:Ca2+-binding RTX toxin-like protein
VLDGSKLGVNDVMTISASAANAIVYGGAAADTLTGNSLYGGAGADNLIGNFLYGGAGDDTFVAATGADILSGGTGNDTFNLQGDFKADDTLDGGRGFDTLLLKGDYSAGIVFGANSLMGVEKIVCAAGHNGYTLTLDDANVATGHNLAIDASALNAVDNALHFSGAAETDGTLTVMGGSGDDIVIGGAGQDTIVGGAGADTIVGGGGADALNGGDGADQFGYAAVLDSGMAAFDTISGFDAASDVFDLWFTVAGLDSAVAVHRLSQLETKLDASHLEADHAVLVTVGGARTFLVIDANGTAGYQANGDILINLATPANLDQLSSANFI